MLITNSPKIWLGSIVASLVIFAIIWFAFIKPTTDDANNTANKALEQGLQLQQQATKNAQQQLSQALQSVPTVPATPTAGTPTTGGTAAP
jgi:flagellar biosynthesis/type III secretory pathway M-ring protein FliF/YscJ